MKKQHRIKSDSSELIQTTQPQNLELAQKKALDDCAVALQSITDLHEIVKATNHPTPGTADIEHTRMLQKACKMMEIGMLDHIIVSPGSYFSFADECTTKFNNKIDR